MVDSGVANVPDLRGKVAATFWDPRVDTSAADTVGHGTFVSSIIAARNDDGRGLAGFCGACRLAVYKADPLDDAEIAAGIERLTAAHVRIINLSVVLPTASQQVVDALDAAMSAGVLVVVASGNEGAGTIDFPASSVQPPDGVPAGGIVVGASDAAGRRAPFSNWGSQLSLLAPGSFDRRCGVGVIGALPEAASDFDRRGRCDTVFDYGGARYAYATGTSFAAPEVAGIAALVWAAAPSLTNVQVATILEQTATRPVGVGWTPTAGWGVVDARAALEAATGRSSADSLTLSRLHVGGPRRPGATVTATVRARWGDGTPVLAGAAPACTLSVRGHPVPTRASLAGGRVTCRFRLPPGSGGARATGSISVAAPSVPPASAIYAFVIRS